MAMKTYLKTPDITPVGTQFTTGGGSNPFPDQIEVHSFQYKVEHACDPHNGRIKANRIQNPIVFGIEAQAGVADLFQACSQGRNIAKAGDLVFSFMIHDGDKSAASGKSNQTVYMTVTLSKEVFVKSVTLATGDERANASASSSIQGSRDNSSIELVWCELSYQKIDFNINGKSPKQASDDWSQ
jgi:type VI protein secretion system component Hcp